jgi:hypothetical protein
MANEPDRPQRSALEFTARTLINVVRGLSSSAEPGPALRELLRRSAASRNLLNEVVGDEDRPPELRETAAVALGREPHPEAEEALAKALAADDPSLVRRAAEALGKIGSEAALAALATAGAADEPARRSVAFAKALISARLGLAAYALADPPQGREMAVDRNTAERLLPSAVPAKDKRAVLADAEKELPGIALSEQAPIGLECGRHVYALLLTRQLGQIQDLDALADAGAVLGVLFERAPTGDHYFLSEYVLANPGREGRQVEIYGVRPTGAYVHCGELQPASGVFRLRTVDPRASPPVDIHGAYDAGTGAVRFDEILVQSDFRVTQMEPTPE